MVHWVYILRCGGEIEEWERPGINDKVYVGETLRLYRRLKEHVDSDRKGSCTTSEFYPNRLNPILFMIHEKQSRNLALNNMAHCKNFNCKALRTPLDFNPKIIR